MAVTKESFLVGLLAILCLSLTSANRVLKGNDAENESISDSVSRGQDDQLQTFSQAELKSTLPKGKIPKFSSVGPTNGDCCNYGNNCGNFGGGYTCPPNNNCGGNLGCQSCYSCSPYPWQGCQGCQGPPPPCDCRVLSDNNSKVQHESIQAAEPDPHTDRVVPPVHPVNHNIKSSRGANQDMKSKGGLV